MTLRHQKPGVPYKGEHLAACIASYFRLWRAPVLHERNPCAQPVSMERRHIPEVQNGDYVVADKSEWQRRFDQFHVQQQELVPEEATKNGTAKQAAK